MRKSLFCRVVLLSPLMFFLTSTISLFAEDWAMWRYDAGRSARSNETLPAELELLWTRQLPPLTPAYRNARLQFDAGYEPVVAGKTMFVGSSRNDRLTAYKTETGEERWRFYADGPIRFAPVCWQKKVYFGSDDGTLYCLDAVQGNLIWKFRAAPSSRQVIGNGRLISLWPLRGGLVISQGRVYFAAGVWSFEGVFIYALDATTGKKIWVNDHTGYIYGQHPHDAKAFGGVTPQGYLVVSGEDLVVPCGAALPATFDLKTGRLKEFALPKEGRVPGGWFSAQGKAQRRGEKVPGASKILLDANVNKDRHEDDQRQGPGEKGIQSTIAVKDREFKYEEKIEGVSGTIHSLIAADGKLFVVTKQGMISCLGKRTEKVITHKISNDEKSEEEKTTKKPSKLVKQIHVQNGYGVLLGIDNIRTINQLLEHTNLKLIGIDKNAEKIATLRRLFDERGVYGDRISLVVADSATFEFPPYLANVILCWDEVVPEGEAGKKMIEQMYESLRPYGGKVVFRVSSYKNAEQLFEQLKKFQQFTGAKWGLKDSFATLVREGALSGSTNYTGSWSSPDQLVRAPLGVLWFGDEVGHFKRAPQPDIVDGVMISYDKSWKGFPSGDRPPYKLKTPTYSDVYTGRKFTKAEIASQSHSFPKRDVTQKQKTQYRPPTQKHDWRPEPPVLGTRTNPLTGKKEPRQVVKSYGCDGGVDYGLMFTVRSGTAAFYDKRTDSGTIHISGPRSGCTNSIIPANGVLNIPYFYQGCTCSYPLPVGLSMYSLPEQHEQWTVWGEGEPKQIQRVGINFGAPGDRVTNAGTLWLDSPLQGGPSPKLDLEVLPKNSKTFYHHSLWVAGGEGWSWVAASGVEGVESIRLKNLKPGEYKVRLYFLEPENQPQRSRLFDVSLQGKKVLTSFDVVKQSGGKMRAVVKEFSHISSAGEMTVSLNAIQGVTIISGIELISQDLPAGKIVEIKPRNQKPQLTSF